MKASTCNYCKNYIFFVESWKNSSIMKGVIFLYLFFFYLATLKKKKKDKNKNTKQSKLKKKRKMNGVMLFFEATTKGFKSHFYNNTIITGRQKIVLFLIESILCLYL